MSTNRIKKHLKTQPNVPSEADLAIARRIRMMQALLTQDVEFGGHCEHCRIAFTQAALMLFVGSVFEQQHRSEITDDGEDFTAEFKHRCRQIAELVGIPAWKEIA